VGGFSAINLDVQKTSQHDRTVIIPLVLAVVYVILSCCCARSWRRCCSW
jgi:RND superfamily putative drug exporter